MEAEKRPEFKRREQKAPEVFIRETTEPNEEGQAVLDSLDYDTMTNLLSEEAGRSSIPADQSKKFPIENIRFNKPGMTILSAEEFGTYSVKENLIGINFEKIKKTYGKDTPLAMIKIVMHELIHGTAKTSTTVKNERETKYEMGYNKVSIRTDMDNISLYQEFNEIVTETMAIEMARDYAKRTGITKEYAAFEKKYGPGYEWIMGALPKITKKIADAVGVEQKRVWEAIKQGAFAGSNLNDKDIQKSLTEIFPEDFMDQLALNEVETVMEKLSPNKNKWKELLGFFLRKGLWKAKIKDFGHQT